MLPIRTDRTTRERYSQGAGIHRLIPAAVARPEDVATLIRTLEWAAAEGLPVVPRGAGTGMAGGNVGAGMVLELCGLGTREPNVDPRGRVVRVDAGVALSRVQAAAATHRLRFGPDPSSAAWATVGGIISTNAAGARSYRLGATDRWVEAVDLVTIDGPLSLARSEGPDPSHPVVARFRRDAEPLLRGHRAAVLDRVPRTRKDTAGYGLKRYHERGHLLDLVVGSEGTLAIVTGSRLRLEPVPAERAPLELRLRERAALPALVEALAASAPTSIELFDRSFLAVVATAVGSAAVPHDPSIAAVLLVDLEADVPDDLERRIPAASDAAVRHGAAVAVAHADEAIAALWALRHRASPILAGLGDGRRSLQVIEDGCVPLPMLAAYLDAVDAACREAAIDAVMFGHAGDGHVHVNLLPDLGRPDWPDAVRHVYAAVTEAQLRLGGTPAGEHGAGRLRAPILERFVGAEAMACMRAVKRAFDPEGRLNPGVILPDAADPLGAMKVGPDAAPIAPAVAADLHRIEAERRWGESRWMSRDG